MGGLFGRSCNHGPPGPDPNVAALILELHKQNNQVLALIEVLKKKTEHIDQNNYFDKEKEIFDKLLTCVDKVVPHKLQGYENNVNIGFIGNVDVGKSTLINTLSGMYVARTGRGVVTLEITPYRIPGSNVVFWDFPGRTDVISYTNYVVLSFVKGMSKVVICERTAVSNCSRILQIISRMGVKCCIVMTNDDEFTEEDRVRQTRNDRVELEGLRLGSIPYFRVDTRNAASCSGISAWLVS